MRIADDCPLCGKPFVYNPNADLHLLRSNIPQNTGTLGLGENDLKDHDCVYFICTNCHENQSMGNYKKGQAALIKDISQDKLTYEEARKRCENLWKLIPPSMHVNPVMVNNLMKEKYSGHPEWEKCQTTYEVNLAPIEKKEKINIVWPMIILASVGILSGVAFFIFILIAFFSDNFNVSVYVAGTYLLICLSALLFFAGLLLKLFGIINIKLNIMKEIFSIKSLKENKII